MSIIEQVKELRKAAKWFDSACFPEGVKLANEAADTIESLSAKLQAANEDLISRSALLQEINGEENAKADQLMHEWYADMVERQPAANMELTAEDCGGWITCNERLPVTRNNILICQGDGYVSIGYYSPDRVFLD